MLLLVCTPRGPQGSKTCHSEVRFLRPNETLIAAVVVELIIVVLITGDLYYLHLVSSTNSVWGPIQTVVHIPTYLFLTTTLRDVRIKYGQSFLIN